ncbi:hypothetical protein [Haliscomenobacter hydrossis]|uniref:Heat shock protein DnaJ domain protein n=1 Tax=Haliscomenobacter hydrossis (strain ATCC 27775 / DSM 1100 / LMG 10767 / O) TaxID=760192 RepID=F4L5H5_HALH1|nr:hypothetical protein [Haliscomenobacter hydrossis]AEE50839.1 hypothetical protein Halhy_2975 [Haliscomenobacter hydrossis DSM 1100]
MKKPISIKVAKNDNSPKAKRQKQFNTLVNKINKLKQQLEDLKDQMSTGMVFYRQEIKPLHEKQQDLMAEEVRALHRAYPHKIFGKKDREKIADLILSRCQNLFQIPDRDFVDLTEIYNHYADHTRDELEVEMRQENTAMAEDVFRSFGLDVELDEEDDLEQMMEKAQAAAERKRLEEEQRAEFDANRPKTEKQKLKEERERQREKDVQKVSKNIYNDLVRLLHPDLENDEDKKVAKTEIIQKVNEAYERNDLFELLILQAEYLKKEGDALAMMPEKEFKYYIQVLKEQEQELLFALDSAGMMPGFEGYVAQHLCHPDSSVMQMLRVRAVREEKESIKSCQHNFKLAKDVQVLKEALRHYEIEDDDTFDGEDFGAMLGELGKFFEEMEKKGTKNKRR